MVSLPPGPIWIIQRISNLLTPILLLYLLRRSANVYFGVTVPIWATTFLGILLFPLLLDLQIRWSQYKYRTEAEKLGAVVPPEMKADSILPFGLGILKENLDALRRNEYFGKSLSSMLIVPLICPTLGEVEFKRTERFGSTFIMRQFAETRVHTCLPLHNPNIV
jgi:hypothetical protein